MTKCGEARNPWLAQTIWQLVLLYVEVKSASGSAPFATKGNDPDKDDPTGVQSIMVRGQLEEYAGEIFEHQHRRSIFSVCVWRNYAHLIRWDRAGTWCAMPIDYEKQPLELMRFFFYVAQMSDAQLGWDPTVERLLDDKRDRLLREVKTHIQTSPVIEHKATHFDYSLELCIVAVNGEMPASARNDWARRIDGVWEAPPSLPNMRKFLVGHPDFSHRSHTGRCTKGFIAFDLETKTFAYLKDSWRTDHADRNGQVDAGAPRPEMVTYAELQGVGGIAHVRCGGDVYSDVEGRPVIQRTMAHRNLPLQRARIHTRIVIDEIGRGLTDYINGKEMVKVLRDALQGTHFLPPLLIFLTAVSSAPRCLGEGRNPSSRYQ